MSGFRSGHTGEDRRAGTGTERRESLGKRGGSEWSWIGAAGAVGPEAWEGKNTYKFIYVSRVCVGFWAGLRGEVGATDRGWYVRSISECKKSGTAGTEDWNQTYAECTRPT